MRHPLQLVALSLLAPASLAQAPTLTTTVTQTLIASGSGTTQSQPVGPLPAAGVQLSGGSSGGYASVACGPTGGHPASVAGFELHFNAFAFLNYSANASGELVLQLTAPTPMAVLVAAEGSASYSTYGSSLIELDIDNDQTVDATWSAGMISANLDEDGEFGLLVGPAGRSIRIAFQGGGFSSAGGYGDLELTFYAGASPLELYGPACVPLTWSRDPVGGAIYECPAASGSLAFFAFGLNPQQTPLAIAPGCFQLTDVLFAIAAVPANGQASFAQTPLALPSGFQFNVQAAVIDGTGTVQTSNGLLMTGPS